MKKQTTKLSTQELHNIGCLMANKGELNEFVIYGDQANVTPIMHCNYNIKMKNGSLSTHTINYLLYKRRYQNRSKLLLVKVHVEDNIINLGDTITLEGFNTKNLNEVAAARIVNEDINNDMYWYQKEAENGYYLNYAICED